MVISYVIRQIERKRGRWELRKELTVVGENPKEDRETV